MINMLERAGIPKDERPKIVAVTGHVESEYQRKAILSGMQQVYSKPVHVDAIAMILLEYNYNINLPPSVVSELKAKKEEL